MCMTVNTLKPMSEFTYDQLMQWDKDDLVHSIIDYQHQIGSKQSDIECLLKCIEKLMKDK